MAEVPLELPTGRVVGKFIFEVQDNNDPGEEPQLVPVTGDIIIKSSIDNLSIFDPSLGKFITFRGPHKAIVNSEGELATPDPITGDPMYTGMSLWSNDSDKLSVKGWTYTATFNLKTSDGKTLNLPPATFTLATGQEVDLADVIKVPATPGYGLPQAEGFALRAEAAAVESKSRSQLSAQSAQLSAQSAQQALTSAQAAQASAEVMEVANDTSMSLVASDPESEFSTRLSAAIVEGVVNFGASDAVQPFLSIIENNTRDANVMLIGDSTANETWEWGYLWFQDFAAQYPSHSFEYRLWNDDNQSYDPAIVFGSGTFKVTFWNASIAGATSQSWQAARITPAIYNAPADLVLISIGHNEGSGTTYPWAWRSRYLSLTESIKAKKPKATLVLIGQNPASANNWQAQRIEVYKEIASRQGYGFIDVHDAFIKVGSDLTIDGIHPNPTGARLWADVMLSAFTKTKSEPRPQQVSLLSRRAAENKMPNPVFNDWTGSIPTGWTVTSSITVQKVTTGIESGTNGLKLTPTVNGASVYYNMPISLVAGKTFTLAVRAKIDPISTGRPGRIGFYDNVNSSKLQATGSDPTDGYRWFLHEGSFDASATTARVYIYAGNAGDSITVDRIILTEGIDPTDAVDLAVASSGGSGTGSISTGWVELTELTLGTGVTVDNVRVKREGSLVSCQIRNMVIPSDSVGFTVATGIPSGFRSVSGPPGAVSATWVLGTLAGGQNPRYQQSMSVNNNYIRWEGAHDIKTGTVISAPTRIDGVMMWSTDDSIPA